MSFVIESKVFPGNCFTRFDTHYVDDKLNGPLVSPRKDTWMEFNDMDGACSMLELILKRERIRNPEKRGSDWNIKEILLCEKLKP
jgi:hypothetical protein